MTQEELEDDHRKRKRKKRVVLDVLAGHRNWDPEIRLRSALILANAMFGIALYVIVNEVLFALTVSISPPLSLSVSVFICVCC